MLNELKIFKDVIEKLGNNRIQYMVSGSVAMNYYTTPRMTRDIDIVIEIKDAEKFYEIFKDGYYIDLKALKDAVQKQQMFNIIHLEEVIKIDFIVKKETRYRETEFNRRKKFEFEGTEIFIVTIEDLILSKLLWAKESISELHIRDIKNLLAEKVDMEYIKEWIKKLDLEDFFKKIIGNVR